MEELDHIETLIIRCLDKTANEQELVELKNWLSASEENKKLYCQFKDVWDATNNVSAIDADKAWINSQQRLTGKKLVPKWSIELLKIASVAILVAVATYSVFNWPSQVPDYHDYAKVTVPNGSQSTVQLADGTNVKLNAGSELIYPAIFSKSERRVELKGEAYFSVKHNPEHPFIVSAGDIEVKVLGTEFNVLAYPEDKSIETTLVNGKVHLSHKNMKNQEGIILKPGEKAIYKQGKLTVAAADVKLETNWLQKGISFQSASIGELVLKLERWYDADIQLNEDDFKGITFTGKFRNNETIWQVLDVIKMTTPIAYAEKEGKIIITLNN